MKRTIFIILSLLFLSSFLFSHEMEKMEGKKGMNMEDMMDENMHGSMMEMGKGMECCKLFHLEDAKYRIKNTKKGVKIYIESSNKKIAKEIQKLAKEWLEKKMTMNIEDKEAIVVCPVMKRKMKVKDAVGSIEYKGKKYYFCCPSCIKMFKKNPEKYIK